MIERLQGIVLRTVKYSDNDMMVDMFTDMRGRTTFNVRVARKSRSLSSASLWRPLSLVEFDTDIRPNRAVNNIKNARAMVDYNGINASLEKSCQVLFMAEVLYHALKNEPRNRALYDFINLSMQWLELAEQGYANFHIVFSVQLMRFLGIFPNLDTYYPNAFFDMMEGNYSLMPPPHAYSLRPPETEALPVLARLRYTTMRRLKWSRAQRGRCLKLLNDYYRLHIPSFPELKSIDVLTEVFD